MSDQKRQLDHLAIQSGGFNTEFLQKFNPRELLGVQSAGIIEYPHCMPEDVFCIHDTDAAGSISYLVLHLVLD